MRIFINGNDKDSNFDELVKRSIIYTTEGIFCNHNKKLTRIEYEDSGYTINKDKYVLLMDTSKEIYGDTLLHIPYDHIYCEETFEKKHIGYNIYYVKHSYFDQVSYFFELDHATDFLVDEIISFLSRD